ncbi:13943_t:CDS:2 [Acaulospora morrowiae]|uniref:13943_t:CDS:1 n=1 Tax=Acaulospora morrowiae TaxID=94023 RepID=A0A9N8ZM25_9GLOM|nr:13943_t:CDS:2 [Acaulospora morrowiae]
MFGFFSSLTIHPYKRDLCNENSGNKNNGFCSSVTQAKPASKSIIMTSPSTSSSSTLTTQVSITSSFSQSTTVSGDKLTTDQIYYYGTAYSSETTQVSQTSTPNATKNFSTSTPSRLILSKKKRKMSAGAPVIDYNYHFDHSQDISIQSPSPATTRMQRLKLGQFNHNNEISDAYSSESTVWDKSESHIITSFDRSNVNTSINSVSSAKFNRKNLSIPKILIDQIDEEVLIVKEPVNWEDCML